MTKSVLIPPVFVTMIILLMFLSLPFIASAEQVEDIAEIEQVVRPVDESAITKSTDMTVSSEKQSAGTPVIDDGKTVFSSGQDTAEYASHIKTSDTVEPLKVPEQNAAEKPPAEMTGLGIVSTTKDAEGKLTVEKVEPDRTTVSKTPANPQKSAGSTTSTWQSFLAFVGLHDDRHSIPPLEVKSTLLLLGQDYIIGPGDVLGISVWRDDSLTKSVVVLPDGKIQFPLIGEILAGGKSVAQLKQEFVEKLARYVVDADISVEVKQSNSLFVYIIGRVNGPGRQMLVADTSVLQALAMAGGLNPFAEKDDIKIFRQDKDRTLVYSFRYSHVVSGNYLDDNLLLKRGDVIVVP